MMRLSHYRKVLPLLQTRNRQFSVKTEIESKIISTEIIKPSFPTPKSLQKHQLSFLDQLMPTILVPSVYFYSSNSQISNSQKSNHLKKSLSETLSKFYPLAGRMVDKFYVDCNDDGALFAEAEANCDLSRVITNPDPDRIQKLLISKLDESKQRFCLAVQATYFRCGGLALSILISHKIADASSMITFANTWSAMARDGGHGVPSPKFDAASYFPPKNIPEYDLLGLMQEEIATRILTFSAARIAALQERYATTRRRPSRVAALSAYLWTRFIFATGKQADPTYKISNLHTAVNLRSLVEPPMSEYHFGNIFSTSAATLAAGDSGAEVVQKVWEAKKEMWTTAAKEMDEMYEKLGEVDSGEGIESLVVSSLCRFPLYEVDFGWGKPVWAVVRGLPVKNVAIFTDTKSGGGIEVQLRLTKQDMEKFEAGSELND